MNLIKKLKSKRGATLVEVLMVVALMAIMLGIAMPNILAESEEIKMAEMNDNARAVAVAVQSKLYGMKNAGTSADSAYFMLCNTAAYKTKLADDETGEDVLVINNFIDGEGNKGDKGREQLLSGAITDSELLDKGKIVVVFKESTADVLEVFYSDKDYNLDDILPQANEHTLKSKRIGLYRGEGAPEPARNITLPRFVASWSEDDELALDISMPSAPDSSLYNKPLGIEVYLQFPALDGSDSGTTQTSEEMLIYAEGMFETEYRSILQSNLRAISADYNNGYGLTLGKIVEKGSKMRFILDTLVMDRVNSYALQFLRRPGNPYPDIVSVAANDGLNPRETFKTWMSRSQNTYITYWYRQHATAGGGPNEGDKTISQELFKSIMDDKNALSYVGIDERCRLRVKIGLLDDSDGGKIEDAYGSFRKFDESMTMSITSDLRSPYFSQLDTGQGRVGLSSMRDLNNLHYVADDGNTSIKEARLYADITGDQFYNKLKTLREKLLPHLSDTKPAYRPTDKEPTPPSEKAYTQEAMNDYRFQESVTVSAFPSLKKFTFDGTKAGGGSFKIQNINFPGKYGNTSPEPGGLVELAEDCTFMNLDIVNARVWRALYSTGSFETSGNGNLTNINIKPNGSGVVDGGVGGALVGISLNSKFKNVRAYIDNTEGRILSGSNFTTFYVNTSVAGGLVGLAIGGRGNSTTFDKCCASYRLADNSYDRLAGKLVYAGGLVGMTIGNVNINNCYGASAISAYYSGGLVGAAISNEVSLDIQVLGSEIKGDFHGETTIKNSFAAGEIGRGVRVGAGLIADIQGNTPPNVTNCYSSTWWQIIPPVAYGTFENDTQNYYVRQSQFAVPVTNNVEAWFKSDGDVLSLQNNGGKLNGIVCSSADASGDVLSDKLGGAGNWTKATQTYNWSYTNGLNNVNDKHSYPFPMPKGNTEFFGNWMRSDCYGATTPQSGTPTFTFQGYYGVFYCDEDGTQHADAGQAMSRDLNYEANSLKFQIYRDKNNTYHYGFQNISVWWLHGCKLDTTFDEQGNLVQGNEVKYWWARRANTMGLTAKELGGVTDVSVSSDGKSFEFTAPEYYNASYNPFEGYGYIIDGTSLSDSDRKFVEKTKVYLDYMGFFCTSDTSKYPYERYYIKMEDGRETPTRDEAKKIVSVDKATFQKAVNYQTYTLSATDVTVTYEDGYFHVINSNG